MKKTPMQRGIYNPVLSWIRRPVFTITRLVGFIPLIIPLPSIVTATIHKLRGVRIRKCNRIFIGYGAWIDSASPKRVHIGKHVIIGPYVKIITHSVPTKINTGLVRSVFDDVYIEDGALIGIGSIILPGVRVGKGAIVGGGSVVTKDVPRFCVVAGNPAKVIKELKK